MNSTPVIGMSTDEADKALAQFDSGKPAPPAVNFGLPTAGSLATQATGSKTAGALTNMALSATPVGMYNAAATGVNTLIGAINEFADANRPTAMNGPALVGKDGVGAAQAIPEGGFNNQTGEGGVPKGNTPAAQPAESGAGSEQQGGLVAGAMNPTSPLPPAPPAPPATPVNYNTFGSMNTAGWSRSARRFANAKRGVPQ